VTDKPTTKPTAQGSPVTRKDSAARKPNPTVDAFRDADGVTRSIQRPLKAIREKCKDCCCGNLAEVRRCTIQDCSLWPWRFGRRPRPDDFGGQQHG
jgi:hypothetical protein